MQQKNVRYWGHYAPRRCASDRFFPDFLRPFDLTIKKLFLLVSSDHAEISKAFINHGAMG